jgi:hypothetical protein
MSSTVIGERSFPPMIVNVGDLAAVYLQMPTLLAYVGTPQKRNGKPNGCSKADSEKICL